MRTRTVAALALGSLLLCSGLARAQDSAAHDGFRLAGSGSDRMEGGDSDGGMDERAPAGSAREADKPARMPGSAVTVEGTLVDLKCYPMNPEKNIGNDHVTQEGDVVPRCGAACAKMGFPVGLVQDGKAGRHALVLVAPSVQLAGYMARTLRVKGRLIGETLIVNSIEVRDGGRWTPIKLRDMM